jgi:CRP/FNR family cyclic AMP-dependent transcriptional regulator
MVDFSEEKLDVTFTEDELLVLQNAEGVSPVARPANTTIMREGERTDHAFLIVMGWLKVLSGSPRQTVFLRGPGEIVGEMSAIRRKPRSADVCTLTDVVLFFIPAATWRTFLDEHPRAAKAQMYALGERLEEATRRTTDTFVSAERKIAKAIVELESKDLAVPGPGTLLFPIGQRDLAEIAGTSIESAKDTMRAFRNRSIVRTGRMQIIVSDMDMIRKISHGDATAFN